MTPSQYGITSTTCRCDGAPSGLAGTDASGGEEAFRGMNADFVTFLGDYMRLVPAAQYSAGSEPADIR
jgi:hypothetical protein